MNIESHKTTQVSLETELAAAKKCLAGNEAAERGEISEALQLLEEALELNANLTEAAASRAALLEESGQTDAAVSAYGQLLEQEPDNYLWRERRGLVHYEKGAYDAALLDLNEAATLLERQRAETGESFDLLDELGEIMLMKGLTLEQTGAPEAAAEAYARALSVAPELCEAHLCRAEIRHQAGELEGAVADYAAAIELSERSEMAPESLAGVYFNRAVALNCLERCEEAVADMKKANELGSEHARAALEEAGLLVLN